MQPGPPSSTLLNVSHSTVSGGTFIQNIHPRSGERAGYARLLEEVATSALHDSVDNVDPPKCHPNTRVAIIDNIRDWTMGTDEELRGKPILWLKGAAGAGKSAIARSVAERSSDEGLLLGAFFFNAGDVRRNHVGSLVATISYQISTRLPEFRDIVSTIIEDYPLIFKSSLKTQFSTLIVRPLSAVLANRSTTSSTPPCLIIIDGLDECSAANSQRDLILTLQEVTSTTTLIRFLVCSRPESHLNSTFGSSWISPILRRIFLDDDRHFAGDDIRVYLEDKFMQIKEGHPFKHFLPDPWPTPAMVDSIVDKSSGQFIYAATVVRYIDSPKHRPDQRLNAIFKLRPPFKDLPFSELDALYRLIISKADELPTVLDILVFPALYDGFYAPDIEIMLQLEQGSVEVMLADLHSIVSVATYPEIGYTSAFVKLLHKSLADFLSEPQRSGDLYRALSSARRAAHATRVISIFSTRHSGQQTGRLSYVLTASQIIRSISTEILNHNKETDYVSSDIFQASTQFPMFEYITYLLLYSRTAHKDQIWPALSDLFFIRDYFNYLHCIKNVCESTRLVYWEQIHQYCESVLAVLDNNLSGNWDAHFVFAYYCLLHDPACYCLPRKICRIDLNEYLSDMEVKSFGFTAFSVVERGPAAYPTTPFCDNITKIFHDLLGDTKKKQPPRRASWFILGRSPPSINGHGSIRRVTMVFCGHSAGCCAYYLQAPTDGRGRRGRRAPSAYGKQEETLATLLEHPLSQRQPSPPAAV
ncbi:hypothetical protein D9613_012809 [Agrocybe pediades]|uniref:Nephrocystin 3-like N-terminal domain-containing protein n=1 Tax=Agrocybe pediades TaxID=84607 RepID=A0A8H4R3C9_9AGAR|nr:hypothetical protein D9613_012809 [Agrocybe pediades]